MVEPFYRLLELVDEYSKNRNNLTVEELQDLREDISLNLFLMNDIAAKAVSNYDAQDFKRKNLTHTYLQ